MAAFRKTKSMTIIYSRNLITSNTTVTRIPMRFHLMEFRLYGLKFSNITRMIILYTRNNRNASR